MKFFEDSYSSTESSPVLWIAFFLENARFSTICNVCLDQIEQDKRRKQLCPVGVGVPTRPGDVSSDDESDDDGQVYDPISVTKPSDEGRMMTKWLHASRGRLRGDFPTASAIRQTKHYLDKMNNRKSTKEALANTQGWGDVSLNEMGGYIIKRWYKAARQSALSRFDQQADNIRDQLHSALDLFDIEDDWAFGELRLNGNALKIEGYQIAKQKEVNESQCKTELENLSFNFSLVANDIENKRANSAIELESAVSQIEAELERKKMLRTLDLNKKIEDLEQSTNCDEEEVKALRFNLKTEMDDEDMLAQTQTSDLTSQYDYQMKVFDREHQSTLQMYERNCQLIADKVRKEYVIREREWQKNALLWLEKASRARSSSSS